MQAFVMCVSFRFKCLLMEDVKLIGTAEPSDSSYHVRRMEKMEQVDNLEEELLNNEGRHVVVKLNLFAKIFFSFKDLLSTGTLSITYVQYIIYLHHLVAPLL